MLKKIVLASAILSSTIGIATAAQDLAPYVGAGLGVTVNTLNTDSHGHEYGISNYRGVPFNLFAGYGGIVSQSYYLAGELGATLATANISGSNALKTTYGFGASIIPGIMLSDHTLAYGRLGVVRSKFDNDDMRNGGQFGLGMQTSLTQNVDLRGEYDFIAYKSISSQGISVSPRADQFTVGLVYKFD